MAHAVQGSLAGAISWVSLKQDIGAPHACPPSNPNPIPSISKLYPGFHPMTVSRCQPSRKGAHFIVALSSSNNGSVFSPRPDPDSNEHNSHPSPETSDAASQPNRNPWQAPGLVSKQITESFVDKSRRSLEGLQQQQPTEQDQDKSLTSYEGHLQEDEGAKPRRANNEEVASSSTSDTDSLWRSVFPAYMRSKDEEDHPNAEGDACLNGSVKGLGLHGAAAARAAAAAAASAKELESHVNSSTNPSLSPSVSAPPCSSAQSPVEGGKKLKDLISDDPIWAAIRAEARLEAEREPILSSFLYASILAHPCFERSLGFVLANRLKNATLLATQLMDVFDDVFMNDVNIRQAIRLDVQAVKDRDPSCRSYSSALLYLKGYHALQSYRVAHVLWNRGRMVLALALQSRISEVFAVDIHPAARIGKAILLDHGTGVVIGETAVVGDRVSMLQGVTLGGTGKVAGDRHPKIGEGVLLGAGATILGNINVGRGAMVAAGSLVLKDVPPHSMVAGTPARVVGVLEEPTPSLTMKHDVTKDLWESLGNDSVCGGTGI